MSWYLVSPELSMAALAVVVILLDLVIDNKKVLAGVATAGLIVPLGLALSLGGENETTLNGMFVVDNFALFFKLLFIGVSAMVIMGSGEYVATRLDRFRGEFIALILLSALGLMLMAATRELISIYVSLELSSMALYALTAMLRDRKSTEAGIKYLLLGAIASAVLLYGMALIYGLTGSTHLADISAALGGEGSRVAGLLVAVGLIGAGFAFKIASVPFHMWAPDVYEGAPTPVTAYLSVASKAAGFAVILRVFATAFGEPSWLADDWQLMWGVLAVVTMTVGNVIALRQTNIKRLLAYSGIAQAGYLMVGIAAGTEGGQSAIMFFLLVYAFANLGAFITVIAISNKTGSDEIDDFSGMIRRAPVLALVLGVCLISLTGIPPTAGFMGKLLVFKSAMDEGLLWLVVFGTVNSVVAAFYYFKVIKAMFLGAPKSLEAVPSSSPLRLTLVVSSIGVLLLGVYPYAVSQFADKAHMLMP